MNATTVDVRSLFQWEDPEVIRLAEGVFGKCILGKVHPPEGELKHQWIAPGGGYYGQWIWDTMFADKTIANALKNGVNERYNALTGKGLGVDFLGMSGTIVTMMLDGLSKKHRLKVRPGDAHEAGYGNPAYFVRGVHVSCGSRISSCLLAAIEIV